MWAGRGAAHTWPKHSERLCAARCRIRAARSSVGAVVRAEPPSAFRRAHAESEGLIHRARCARLLPTSPSPLAALSQSLHHNHNSSRRRGAPGRRRRARFRACAFALPRGRTGNGPDRIAHDVRTGLYLDYTNWSRQRRGGGGAGRVPNIGRYRAVVRRGTVEPPRCAGGRCRPRCEEGKPKRG